MFVGNVCYVTERYNQDKFQLLLEAQLERKKGAKLSNEFIEQCIAAYLACKEDGSCEKETARMERIVSNLGIECADYSTYSAVEAVGNPADAVRAFNQIATDYIRTDQER